MKISLLIRSIRFFFQRRFRGFDDSDTWSLSYTFAGLMIPRLKRFYEISKDKVCPPNDLSDKEWATIITKIINSLEQFRKDEEYDKDDLELLFKYFETFHW